MHDTLKLALLEHFRRDLLVHKNCDFGTEDLQ